MRMRFRSFRAGLRFLGASRDMLLAWMPMAFGALRGLAIDLLLISTAVFVLQLIGSGILGGILRWDNASRYFVLGMGFFYLPIIAYLLLAYRTLHAAGLLLSVDLVGNIFEFVRRGKIRYDEKESRLHLRFRGREDEDLMMKFAFLHFGLHWLWVLVNCMLNATWFFLLVPAWRYPLLFLMGLYAGIHWVIAHRQLDFDWFIWFGTVTGVTGFSGMIAYSILADFVHHPYPELAYYGAFAIGFAWATESIHKYTLRVALAGMFVLVITYFWASIPSISISTGVLGSYPPEQLVLIGLFGLVAILMMVAALAGGKLERHSTDKGAH